MTTRCAHCGKNPAEGLATIDDVRYCHGDWQPSPTCYERMQFTFGLKAWVDVPLGALNLADAWKADDDDE